MYLAVAIIAFFTVPVNNSNKLPLTRELLKQFDLISALLTIAGIKLFTAGISIASNTKQGWKTPYVSVLVILGLALISVFIW